MLIQETCSTLDIQETNEIQIKVGLPDFMDLELAHYLHNEGNSNVCCYSEYDHVNYIHTDQALNTMF